MLGLAELEEADKVDYWKQRFDTLSDGSDLSLKQQLKEQMDKAVVQCCSAPMEGESLATMVKTEPVDDVAVTEVQPSAAADEPSSNGNSQLKCSSNQ